MRITCKTVYEASFGLMMADLMNKDFQLTFNDCFGNIKDHSNVTKEKIFWELFEKVDEQTANLKAKEDSPWVKEHFYITKAEAMENGKLIDYLKIWFYDKCEEEFINHLVEIREKEWMKRIMEPILEQYA